MSGSSHATAEDAVGLDLRSFLSGALSASASAQADLALADLRGLAVGGATPDDIAAPIEARGMALMDLWADLMARTGLDGEPWAREAALRAVRAYAGRFGELTAASSEGGLS